VTAFLDDAELLRRLVAFDSVSRNSNIPIADFISDYLDRPGIRIRRNPSADGTKTNLVIETGPAGNPAIRHGLMLSGHMDVVPAEELEWQSDPFVMTERDDRWVGRGTADMKGFLALAMNRLGAAAARGDLHRPLALFFTFDEELGTLGARHFVETWPEPEGLPRHVVIGEPTELRAVRMHKGHLKLRLTFHGLTAHSGYPHLGRNAIEPAARAIVALAALRDRLAQERSESGNQFPKVPFVVLNVGQVEGGVAVNVVPDLCRVHVGIRILPGMKSEDLVNQVRAAVAEGVPGEDFELEVQGDTPPFLVEEDRPVYREVSGELGQRDSWSVAFATDAGWLQTAGFDCVIFGPGNIETAHKPNEWMPIAEFHAAGRHLDHLIHRFCTDRRSP
jgi:acetylornithine deacetylase